MPSRRGPRLGTVRHLNDDERRRLMTEQAALTALTKHPSWPTLVEMVERQERDLERRVIAQVFSEQGLDPRTAEYMRGVRAGMRYLLRVTSGAEARLEQVLQAQTAEESR